MTGAFPPHPCPGPGHDDENPFLVEYSKLACPAHWAQVPGKVKKPVYRTWAGGRGAGSAAHKKAMAAAVEQMRPL